jgi:hypothetical protein
MMLLQWIFFNLGFLQILSCDFIISCFVIRVFFHFKVFYFLTITMKNIFPAFFQFCFNQY